MGIETKPLTPAQRHEQQDSYRIRQSDYWIVDTLNETGFHYKRIAALFDVDLGRIAEIANRNDPTKKSKPYGWRGDCVEEKAQA